MEKIKATTVTWRNPEHKMKGVTVTVMADNQNAQRSAKGFKLTVRASATPGGKVKG